MSRTLPFASLAAALCLVALLGATALAQLALPPGIDRTFGLMPGAEVVHVTSTQDHEMAVLQSKDATFQEILDHYTARLTEQGFSVVMQTQTQEMVMIVAQKDGLTASLNAGKEAQDTMVALSLGSE